jgi:hypothetical protein
MKCPRCQGYHWVCEAHPDKPFEHDPNCPGPGQPCSCTPRPDFKKLYEVIYSANDLEDFAEHIAPPAPPTA